MILPVIILLLIFLLIAVRQIGNIRLQIWQIMLGGAIAVLLTGQIAPLAALQAINLDIIVFLFCMFLVGEALEQSGYLANLSYRLFRRAKYADHLLLFILFGMGIAAAFLMNDTVAIIGTPVVLLLSKRHNIPPKILLLSLAFAVTIGSVLSPIGNPQNLLIAVSGGLTSPFVTFLRYLLLPTIINLVLAFLLIKLYYRKDFAGVSLTHSQEPIRDAHLALLARISMIAIACLVAAKIALGFLVPNFDFRLTYIAVLAALPILFLSPRRWQLVKSVDWRTLVFFAAMFVVMQSVWDSGFFQSLIASSSVDLASTSAIMGISIVFSQLVSNVPLVALYLPLLAHAGATSKALVALAAGSTIAGNMLILGAASNVIIIQNAEKKSGETLTFWEFARIGIPLTVLNGLVYFVFLL